MPDGPKLPRCELAVSLGGAAQEGQSSIVAGQRVKVKESVVVYHIPKVPQFDLKDCEGVVKEVLGEWKGKPISANLPLKIEFEANIGDATKKFIAHVRDDEVEILS